MSSSLPIVVTGSPNLRIEEDLEPEEYFGPMTYIRVEGTGEAKQDDNGLILWLNGRYHPELLVKIAMAINGRK